MKSFYNILVVSALLGFLSVPPCSGVETTFSNGVLRVRTLVQVEFDAGTNETYTLLTAEKMGDPFQPHPSCNQRKFDQPTTYRLWDNPDNKMKFFKLRITTPESITFTPVTPQPSSPITTSTQEAGASPLPPVPGDSTTEKTDEK